MIVHAKEKDLNWIKNGINMKKYLRNPKESLDLDGNSVSLKPAVFPLMSDYLSPLLTDFDPEQCIEEPYKNKHN